MRPSRLTTSLVGIGAAVVLAAGPAHAAVGNATYSNTTGFGTQTLSLDGESTINIKNDTTRRVTFRSTWNEVESAAAGETVAFTMPAGTLAGAITAAPDATVQPVLAIS